VCACALSFSFSHALGHVFVGPELIKFSEQCRASLKTVAKQKIEDFQAQNAVQLISDTLTPADVINASSRSFAGRIFSEPMKPLGVGFGNDAYIAFCRHFLGLPPSVTVGGETIQDGFDYPVQKCLAAHGRHVCPYLDANANHASSKCPSAGKAVMVKHRNVIDVLANAAREAGLETKKEPDTHSLLLGEFSKTDCRRVFPSKVSSAYKAGFEALSQASDFIASAACGLSSEEKSVYMQNKIDALPILDARDAKGLRIDVSFENPNTGEVIWVDVSVAHTSSPSYVTSELKAIVARKLSSRVAELHLLPDALQGDPSPTLIRRELDKADKYSRLVLVAKKQHSEHKRTSIPKFLPFVVSDCGELAPRAYDLQEWLVDQFRLKCAKEGRRSDGCTTADLVREFRHKLKVAVQLAVAAGLGAMICAAGQPWQGLGQ